MTADRGSRASSKMSSENKISVIEPVSFQVHFTLFSSHLGEDRKAKGYSEIIYHR